MFFHPGGLADGVGRRNAISRSLTRLHELPAALYVSVFGERLVGVGNKVNSFPPVGRTKGARR
jgi:hypothetical protein